MNKRTIKLSKVFTSKNITREKYNEILFFAKILLEHRNNLSEDFHTNYDYYMSLGFNRYLKLMRATYFKDDLGKNINTNFDHGLCKQVFTCYSNLYEVMIKKMRFVKVESTEITKYKRNTKYKKAGDFKGVSRKTVTTSLSIALTHLARHGQPDTVEFIENELENNTKLSNSKRVYYEEILEVIYKFGYHRLYKLAMQHRNRFLNRIKVIEFVSLTFVARTRKKNIVAYNKNYNSKINSFISLSWRDDGDYKGGMYIPISYSKDHFGDIKKYNNKSSEYQYVLTFDERMRKVNIGVMTEEDRYFDDSVKTNFIGCDANAKHNQFILSDNTSFGLDDDLIKEQAKVIARRQKLKRQDKDHKDGRRDRIKQKQLSKKQKHYTEFNVYLCIQYLLYLGVNHIVMEDIDGHMGRSKALNKDQGDINYNLMVGFIGMGTLKSVFERIGKKYGIDVSLIHAPYTSIGCSCCGHIDKENRKSQEIFKCLECGIELNADLNAALNILYRVMYAVSSKLLKKSGNGIYKPKDIRREDLKNILLSFRSQMPYYNKAEEYRLLVSSLTSRMY